MSVMYLGQSCLYLIRSKAKKSCFHSQGAAIRNTVIMCTEKIHQRLVGGHIAIRANVNIVFVIAHSTPILLDGNPCKHSFLIILQ